jgi:hypothetical protein
MGGVIKNDPVIPSEARNLSFFSGIRGKTEARFLPALGRIER